MFIIKYSLNLFKSFRIKDKINNPPKDFNDQEVSKKFKSFMKLKETAQAGKAKKSKIEYFNINLNNFSVIFRDKNCR